MINRIINMTRSVQFIVITNKTAKAYSTRTLAFDKFKDDKSIKNPYYYSHIISEIAYRAMLDIGSEMMNMITSKDVDGSERSNLENMYLIARKNEIDKFRSIYINPNTYSSDTGNVIPVSVMNVPVALSYTYRTCYSNAHGSRRYGPLSQTFRYRSILQPILITKALNNDDVREKIKVGTINEVHVDAGDIITKIYSMLPRTEIDDGNIYSITRLMNGIAKPIEYTDTGVFRIGKSTAKYAHNACSNVLSDMENMYNTDIDKMHLDDLIEMEYINIGTKLLIDNSNAKQRIIDDAEKIIESVINEIDDKHVKSIFVYRGFAPMILSRKITDEILEMLR